MKYVPTGVSIVNQLMNHQQISRPELIINL